MTTPWLLLKLKQSNANMAKGKARENKGEYSWNGEEEGRFAKNSEYQRIRSNRKD